MLVSQSFTLVWTELQQPVTEMCADSQFFCNWKFFTAIEKLDFWTDIHGTHRLHPILFGDCLIAVRTSSNINTF